MTSCHHRRVHRPHDAGPALLRRPAPGAGSQGRRRIQPENQTLASITFQNYFRMYSDKLAGMTGTARPRRRNSATSTSWTWSKFRPTFRSSVSTRMTRSTAPSRKNSHAIVEDIKDAQQNVGQPVLVGTTSIEKSEMLAAFLLQGSEGIQKKDWQQCAQRPLSRAGSAYRRPGRRARRCHHRHQHGRPRYRHPARRQRRHADRPSWRDARGLNERESSCHPKPTRSRS
jgi:hypothetical protein